MPGVLNDDPDATASDTAPWTLAVPVVVVVGAVRLSAYGCSHLLHRPASGQDPRFKVERPTPGTFRWTTPAGRQYTTEPTRYPI